MIVISNTFRLFNPKPLLLPILMMLVHHSMSQNKPVYGVHDTITVAVIVYKGDTIPYGELAYHYITAPAPPGMKARLKEWTRLRNAVYVTYPYARKAGAILNEINAKTINMRVKDQRKAYIRSREKELKKEFNDPLTNLSVYQGRVLMKLINRQTGNNCYDIIKEYKGGFTARFYQTIAFFFDSSLKQPYVAEGNDQQIEMIVQEVERMYGIR